MPNTRIICQNQVEDSLKWSFVDAWKLKETLVLRDMWVSFLSQVCFVDSNLSSQARKTMTVDKYFRLLAKAFDSKFLGEGCWPWQYRSSVALVEGLLSGQVDLTVGILIAT